jgi:hypothetical protein
MIYFLLGICIIIILVILTIIRRRLKENKILVKRVKNSIREYSSYLAYKQDILGLYRYIYDIKISKGKDKYCYLVTLYVTCAINEQFQNYIKIIENDLQTTIFSDKGVVLVEAINKKELAINKKEFTNS